MSAGRHKTRRGPERGRSGKQRPDRERPGPEGPAHDGPPHGGPTHDGPAHNGPAHDGSPHGGPAHDGPEPAQGQASGRERPPGPGLPSTWGEIDWPTLVRGLRPRYPQPNRRGPRRWLPSTRQTLMFFMWCAVALTAVVGYVYAQTDIPKDLNAVATQQDNVYYWADGTEMARVGPIDRQSMPLDRIPSSVQWAVLAAENASFYTDPGVSPKGISRALYEMATGGDTQGGSTITQQYVKNVYLNQGQTLSRKLTEMFISVKLDNKMSKQQILDGYLNTSWFGRGAYGVQRAAKAYYGEDVSQLNASQAAFLATLLKGAGIYDPTISAANHARAVSRWNWVLDRMVKIGRLSPAERATYTTFPEPKAAPKPVGLSGQTGYLVDTARAYVAAHSGISDAQFDLGGYQIYTTFERPKVTALAAAVKKETSALKPSERPDDRDIRVGAASVGTDGRILALYGGPDYLTQGFDDANISIVPAGTTYTPFVYAAGLRDGVVLKRDAPRTPVTPGSFYNGDDEAPVQTPEGPYWDRGGRIVKGHNVGDRSWGEITLRKAVVESVNAPILQLGMDVGLNQVRQASVDAGLLPNSFGEQIPDFSLGTATPSPIRMASAYGTFAAQGTHTDPYSVLRITHDGVRIDVQRPAVTHPFTPQVADEVDDALRGSVTEGVGRHAGEAGPGLAGMPGTALDDKASWFVGYDPKVSTSVALFRVDPKTQELLPLTGMTGWSPSGSGSTYPIDIWTRYMKAVR